MRRKAKHYTLEFKQKVVELSYAKGSVSHVCEDLDISPVVLYWWLKEAELEPDILKKAIGIFSTSDKKNTGS